MTILLIGVAVVLALLALAGGALAWYVASRTHRVQSAAGLQPLFERLVRAPDPRAHLFARVRRGPESLQFHRRDSSAGPRIMLEYTLKEWTSPYQDAIRRMTAERRLPLQLKTPATGRVLDTLVVDFGTDAAGRANSPGPSSTRSTGSPPRGSSR